MKKLKILQKFALEYQQLKQLSFFDYFGVFVSSFREGLHFSPPCTNNPLAQRVQRYDLRYILKIVKNCKEPWKIEKA